MAIFLCGVVESEEKREVCSIHNVENALKGHCRSKTSTYVNIKTATGCVKRADLVAFGPCIRCYTCNMLCSKPLLPVEFLFFMAPTTTQLDTRLARFAAWHAAFLLAGTVGSLGLASMLPIVTVGVLSFGGMVASFRAHWTPNGSFGAANAVTALRLVGVLLLALWPWSPGDAHLALAGLAGVLFLLDGFDGWLARRTGQASAFGAFFDKEVDAFALLVLCLLAMFLQGMVALVVLAGVLRYLFALCLHLGNPPDATEPRTPAARYLYGFMMVAILLPFLPLPDWTHSIVWMAVGGLVASFLPYFVWVLHGRVPVLSTVQSSS